MWWKKFQIEDLDSDSDVVRWFGLGDSGLSLGLGLGCSGLGLGLGLRRGGLNYNTVDFISCSMAANSSWFCRRLPDFQGK